MALLFALAWPNALGGPLRPVAVLLLAGWLLHVLVRFGMRRPTPPRERVLGYAWSLLVPRLHEGGFARADSAFVAGLARLGGVGVEAGQLNEQVRKASAAFERGEAPASHLAALLRLQINFAAEEGEDPVALVVRQVGRCFAGRRPLALAQHLLEDWAATWWTKGNLARLRILLCDQAFEAGYEVSTLVEAAQDLPALASVLGTDTPRSLAALRLLWSQRPTRPWDRLGDARTAFDLAGHACSSARPGGPARDTAVAVAGRPDPGGRHRRALARDRPVYAAGRLAPERAVPHSAACGRGASAARRRDRADPGPFHLSLAGRPRTAQHSTRALVPLGLPRLSAPDRPGPRRGLPPTGRTAARLGGGALSGLRQAGAAARRRGRHAGRVTGAVSPTPPPLRRRGAASGTWRCRPT